MSMETLETRRVLTSLPFGANEFDLGAFMLGSVAVTPVLLESNGQTDASTEDWNGAHIQEVINNITAGLDWWVTTLQNQSSIHQLNFEIDTSFATTPVETQYEPISRRSNDYTLYVAEFLSANGYNSSNIELGIKQFNQDQRVKHDTNWSFTIFVVPSQNDSDGEFAPGSSFNRAFAFAGGLFMIVPSTRPASTYTHEVSHIFWGRDEYPGGGSYFQRRGYYNTQNLNAADNPADGFVQQPSIMASGNLLDVAFANHTSPATTLAMIGWQDSDGDEIFDVLDVPHQLIGSGYFDPANSTYRFTGSAKVQTLPNLNSSGQRNDITLNRIRSIEYRLDGGQWQTHSLPDAYEVDLDLTINIPDGTSEIEIRARDSQTTVVSNSFIGRLSRADATLVPGINGYVWIDENLNGLRDVAEYGQEFWTVELVDSAGDALALRKAIEPDDYADGQLTSGFSNHATVNSVGSDGDGRVGVFNSAQSSTGSKVFYGFSKAAQSYQSTWNSQTRRFQANFNQPTSLVSIDAIGGSAVSVGRLEAYNSSGQLLGRYTTDSLSFGQVETMTIARGSSDIAYIIAGGTSVTSVGLDNLRFGPESTTTTGPQGQFAFPSIPAGPYNVRVTPANGYIATNPNGGQQAASVTVNTATEDVDFGFRSSESVWQNPVNRFDVNDDQFVSAIDVLLIVNDINQNGSRDLTGSGLAAPPYIDVSGDGFVSALDVLLVVNFINQSGSGEGELATQIENSSSQTVTTDSDSAPASLGGFCVSPHSAGGPPDNGNSSAEGEFGTATPPLETFLSPAITDESEDELLDLLASEPLRDTLIRGE